MNDSWRNIPAISDYLGNQEKNEIVAYVRIIYIVAIVVWIMIIFCMGLYNSDVIGLLIICIPVVLFIIAFKNANVITKDVEDSIFKTNYPSIGILITIPLLAWLSRSYDGDKSWFSCILIVSIMLVIASLFDVWVSGEWLRVVQHGTSILQTIALTLIIYAVYTFYLATPHDISNLHFRTS